MPEPHERLERAMQARRLHLRKNWREMAAAAHISYEALRSIRRGDYRPSEITAQDLDDAFRWEHGATLALLDGTGDPVPLDDAPREPTVAELAAELDRQRARNDELERRIAELEGRADRRPGA